MKSFSIEELKMLSESEVAQMAMYRAALDAYRDSLAKGRPVILADDAGRTIEVPPSDIGGLIAKTESALAELEARARLEIQEMKALRKAV